jgi:L-2-hydroxyglutarate oxidase LhgO
LWSPTTAISSPAAIIKALEQHFLLLGGKIQFDTEIDLIDLNGEVVEKNGKFRSKYYINAAGAHADLIAKGLGIAKDYAMIPFMGQYRTIPHGSLPLRTLVYPVPHPINPFLGVHLTLTTDGLVKIGPTALPILGREQYSALSGWNLRDLVPQVLQIKSWARKAPGIRAQLVYLPTGSLEQDFKVVTHGNSIHVLNAVSPGWTSALPFARYIVSQIQFKKEV